MFRSTLWFLPLGLVLGCGDSGAPFKMSDKTTTTSSGLKVEDVTVGSGKELKSGNIAIVHYTGWLTDGKKFDSSVDRDRPFTIIFGTGKPVKGWDEGLVGMKEGGKRHLEIPPDLAFGKIGMGKVPPDATLLYEIELLQIKPGVVIEEVKEGTGPAAKVGDNLLVHYTGKLTTGKIFDSSVARRQPIPVTLGAGQVIPGWEAGLTGMKVGGKRKLTIPPEMAYGEQGYRDAIPPNSTLVFDVELVYMGNGKQSDSPALPFKMSDKTTTTASGLKFEDVTVGSGKELKSGNIAIVHYTGWLTNGKKFDSSVDRNQPFTTIVGAGKVIKGWDEGLVGMKEGGKRHFEIPPDLAYGKNGMGSIPGNATLLFEVELVGIQPGR